jgi:hypothetical protein
LGKWYDFFTGTEFNATDLALKYQLLPGQFHILSNYPLPKPEAGLTNWKVTEASNTPIVVPPSNNVLANEIEQENIIKVYPNPTKDKIEIEVSGFTKGSFSLKINDLLGRNLFETESKGGQKSYSIDLQKLPQGTYFLNAEQGDKRFVKKIFKE